MTERLLSISEIARRTAVAPSALRYYERCDLIQAGLKIGGRRHYPSSVLHRLSTIKFCQRIGFSLTEISELLNGSLARDGAWRQAAMGRRSEIAEQIIQLRRLTELIDQALNCDCHALYECPHMGPQGLLLDKCPDSAAACCHPGDRLAGDSGHTAIA